MSLVFPNSGYDIKEDRTDYDDYDDDDISYFYFQFIFMLSFSLSFFFFYIFGFALIAQWAKGNNKLIFATVS